MKISIRKAFAVVAALLVSGIQGASAAPESGIRFHCAQDTLRIDSLLLSNIGKSGNEAVMPLIEGLIGTPYKSGTLEAEEEILTLNIDELDCTTFVENVVAMSKALENVTPDWRKMAEELKNIRYRKGNIDGYASRLHYFSDWIGENMYRGYIEDITERLPSSLSRMKSLSYMTRHRNEYPALADSAVYDRMKMVEEGFRLLRIPYLKKESIGNKKDLALLRSGDIIAILSGNPDLDVQHVGFIEMRDGIAYLIHASKKEGKVVRESRPLSDYFKHDGRTAAGFRVLRVKD